MGESHGRKGNSESRGTIQEKRKRAAYPLLVKVTENCTPLLIEVPLLIEARRKSTQVKTLL